MKKLLFIFLLFSSLAAVAQSRQDTIIKAKIPAGSTASPTNKVLQPVLLEMLGNRVISYGNKTLASEIITFTGIKVKFGNSAVIGPLSGSDTLTAPDADPLNFRIDLLVVNRDGTTEIITGQPGEQGIDPDYDVNNQIPIWRITVNDRGTGTVTPVTYATQPEANAGLLTNVAMSPNTTVTLIDLKLDEALANLILGHTLKYNGTTVTQRPTLQVLSDDDLSESAIVRDSSAASASILDLRDYVSRYGTATGRQIDGFFSVHPSGMYWQTTFGDEYSGRGRMALDYQGFTTNFVSDRGTAEFVSRTNGATPQIDFFVRSRDNTLGENRETLDFNFSSNSLGATATLTSRIDGTSSFTPTFKGISYGGHYLAYSDASAVTTYDYHIPDVKFVKDAIASGGDLSNYVDKTTTQTVSSQKTWKSPQFFYRTSGYDLAGRHTVISGDSVLTTLGNENSAGYSTLLYGGGFISRINTLHLYTAMNADGFTIGKDNTSFNTRLLANDPTGFNQLYLPDKSGTLVTSDELIGLTFPIDDYLYGVDAAYYPVTYDANGQLGIEKALVSGGGTIDATPTNGSTNAVQSDGVFDALATKASNVLSSGNILVGNGSNVATPATMSGDATLDNAGALTIGLLKITNAKIANSTIDLTTKVTGTLPVGNGGTGTTTSTGTGSVVLSNSPTLVTPALGTPASGTLTNATGLPIATGVSGLGTGVATFLGTPSSANLAGALTDETGTGNAVFSASPTFTGTVTVPTPTVLSNTTVAPSTAWVKAKMPYAINVLDYGATVGDGTDDATAINAAITAAAAGQTVYFPDGTYNLTTTPIALNKAIILRGGNATISISGNNNAITITSISTKIEHLKIVGSGGKDSGSTSQRGISSDGYYYTQIADCDFSGLGGIGIYIKNTAPGGVRFGATITNCNFNANNIGYLADVSAEYVTLTGCTWKFGNSGVIVRAGNNNFVGGSITDNFTVGVKLEGATLNVSYTNDGHGIFSGMTINHNRTTSAGVYLSGYNVYADGLTLGYTFSGCHLYDSKIYVKNSVGVQFNGCHLAPVEIVLEGSTGTQFTNNVVYRNYGFTVTNNANSTQSQAYWSNNRSHAGIAGSFLENLKGGYYNGYMPATTAIGTGLSSLTFTTTYQSTANNLTQTLYTFWDATNHAIENKGLGDNHVNISFNLNCTLNASADASKVIAYLEVYNNNGTTSIGKIATVPVQLYNSTDTATRQLVFSYQGNAIGIEPGQKIKLMIYNQSGFNLTVADPIIGVDAGTAGGMNRIIVEGL